MAKTYKASVEFTCWKQHRCVQCDGTYRYELKRKVSSEASTEAEAEQQLVQLVANTMQVDVNTVPCPTCGTVQPDMTAARQRPFYGWSLVLALVGIVTAVSIGFAQGMTIATVSYIAAAATGLAGLGVLIGSIRNPNGDLEGNRRRAERMIEQGKLRLVEAGDAEAGETGQFKAFAPANLVALVMCAVAVLATLGAVGLQKTNGWPTNDNWYPAVVGPGDSSVYYTNQRLRSIKGYWRGGVSVTPVRPLPGHAHFTAETKKSSWGDTISGKSVSSSTSRLWIRVGVPNNVKLAGKTVHFDAKLALHFPQEFAGGFIDANENFDERGQVVLASPGAGGTYKTVWWLGSLTAAVLMIMATVGLYQTAGRLVAGAHPTEIYEDADSQPASDVVAED